MTAEEILREKHADHIGTHSPSVLVDGCITCDLLSGYRELLALHKEEVRYYLDESGENSWDSIEDVIAYYGDDEVTPEQVKSFSVCAECARLEINLAVLGDYDYAYESSHYPCPTRQIIDKALGVSE